MKKTVNCHDVHGNREDVPIESLRFRPSVYGVIVREAKVLLSRQWDGYDFPGGGIHLGETIDEALEREVREEAGVQMKRGKLLAVKDDFFTHSKKKAHFQTFLFFYSCEYVSGEINTDGFTEGEKEYMQAAVWVPIEEVDSLKFYNPVDSPTLIRMAAEGKGVDCI